MSCCTNYQESPGQKCGSCQTPGVHNKHSRVTIAPVSRQSSVSAAATASQSTSATNRLQRLPLPKFSGRKVDYLFFKEEFERQANYEREGDKVTALKECLVKKADKERVSKERYLTDCMEMLRRWQQSVPVLSSHTAPTTDKQFVAFMDKVEDCVSSLKSVNIGATYIPYKHHQRLHLHPLVLVTGCQIKSPRVQPILRTWGHFGTPCSYVFYFLMGQD